MNTFYFSWLHYTLHVIFIFFFILFFLLGVPTRGPSDPPDFIYTVWPLSQIMSFKDLYVDSDYISKKKTFCLFLIKEAGLAILAEILVCWHEILQKYQHRCLALEHCMYRSGLVVWGSTILLKGFPLHCAFLKNSNCSFVFHNGL